MGCEKGTELPIDLTLLPILIVLISVDISGLLSRKSMYVPQSFWGGFLHQDIPIHPKKDWQKIYIYIQKTLNSYPLMKIDNTEVTTPTIG
jgi:hypothetical protein